MPRLTSSVLFQKGFEPHAITFSRRIHPFLESILGRGETSSSSREHAVELESILPAQKRSIRSLLSEKACKSLFDKEFFC